MPSKLEQHRTDPAHWKLGAIYYCKEDPRIIVRNLLPFGWTWNFAHRLVYPAIAAAIVLFVLPLIVAWHHEIRSPLAYGLIFLTELVVVVLLADRLSREPGS